MMFQYPLRWPEGRPRTNRPAQSQFKRKRLVHHLDEVEGELVRLGARDVVVSTNIDPHRFDPRKVDEYEVLAGIADQPPGRPHRPHGDCGVALWYHLNGEHQCMTADRYDRVSCNVHAAFLTIQALRGVERWGGKQAQAQAFHGFAALPPPRRVAGWLRVLGLSPGASLAQAEARFRQMVKEAHPDRGGTGDRVRELTQAISDARSELR